MPVRDADGQELTAIWLAIRAMIVVQEGTEYMSSKASKDGPTSGVLSLQSMTFSHACYSLQGRGV